MYSGAKLYPGYVLLYEIIANPYAGKSLATIYIFQSIPMVQFGYDLHVPNHTLGHVNIGYGLVATIPSFELNVMYGGVNVKNHNCSIP